MKLYDLKTGTNTRRVRIFLGPILAIGLYEKSRRIEAGQPVHWRNIFFVRPRSGGQIEHPFQAIIANPAAMPGGIGKTTLAISCVHRALGWPDFFDIGSYACSNSG